MASMGRPRLGRLLAGGGFAALGAAAVAAAVAAGPAPAFAFAQDELEQVTITGNGIPEELVVRAEDRPELCASLWSEVDWLVRRRADAREPEDPETLGTQYTLVVHIDGEPRHRFHLYPLAEGGPKAFRPAEQPGDRNVAEGWFHGRLSMPKTLSSAGVPLSGSPLPPEGGAGGGEPAPEQSEEPPTAAFGFLDEWRRGMLLTGAAVVTIVLGLGGIAYLIRRRV
jgi:hypothetical protein